MGLAERALWCVSCGGIPTVTISVERGGVLAHFGACDEHIELVARRVRQVTNPPAVRWIEPQLPLAIDEHGLYDVEESVALALDALAEDDDDD